MIKSKPPARTPVPLLVIAVVLLTACTGEGHRASAPKVDVSLRFDRLDQELFQLAHDSGNFSLQLYARYGPFYKEYVEHILQAAPVDDPRLPIALVRFTMDPDWKSIQEHADSVLGDMATQRAELGDAFGRLKAFFPDSLVPHVIVFNSGFNYGVVPTDSILGIGVEWFVGRDSKVVAMLAPEVFPQYVKDRMRPEMMVPGAMKAWLQVHYARDVRGEDVLTNLVEIGKVMYLLDAVLPATDPALQFAFTEEQLKWCENNEFLVWRELVSKEQLYSKKPEDVDRLLNDGPFTNGLPHESPGHIGEWIGFRMVKSYMDAHPDLTIAQLFQHTDPMVVLKSYKPR